MPDLLVNGMYMQMWLVCVYLCVVLCACVPVKLCVGVISGHMVSMYECEGVGE